MSKKSKLDFVEGLKRSVLGRLKDGTPNDFTKVLVERLGIEVAWMADDQRPGRPEYPTLEQCREAKQALRSEGQRGTREQVAERLGVDLKSVKKRARAAGGWHNI